MAQLRYTKYAMVCGTAALTAGLVGVYLYKNRTAKKDKAQEAEREQESRYEKTEIGSEEENEGESLVADVQSDSKIVSDVERSDAGDIQADVMQLSVAEEAQNSASEDDIVPAGSPEETIPMDEIIEEPITQAAMISVESALPGSILPGAIEGYKNGEGESSMTLDWAAATMQQVDDQTQNDKSLVSPTMSVHSHPEG